MDFMENRTVSVQYTSVAAATVYVDDNVDKMHRTLFLTNLITGCVLIYGVIYLLRTQIFPRKLTFLTTGVRYVKFYGKFCLHTIQIVSVLVFTLNNKLISRNPKR